MAAPSAGDQPIGIDSLPEDLRPPTSRLHRVEYIEIDDSDEEEVAARSEPEDEEVDIASDEEAAADYDLVNDGDSISQTGTIDSRSPVAMHPSRMAQPDDQGEHFADAIGPLRNAADRVSHQMGIFASAVKRFRQESSKSNRKATLRAAVTLICGFRNVAESMAGHSKGNDALKKARSLVGGDRRSDGKPTSVVDEDVIRSKLEAETWDLLSDLLRVDNIEVEPEALRQLQEEPFHSLHRYSSDYDIWRRFLDVDLFATSTVITMRWLEKTSRGLVHGAIDTTIAELEQKANRGGGGVWTRGWLASREKIKAAKRLRGKSGLLEPDDVTLRPRLNNSGQYVETVTHLDPDAPTRQGVPLEKDDQLFEQATWLTMWKMLRQGRVYSEIKDWASERLEQWRAISICGSPVATEPNKIDPFDESFTRMMSYKSLDVWKSACRALANNPASELERAVYGLLCGETESAYKACQGWSDYLYVYLNSILIGRYRDFYTQFQRFLEVPVGGTFSFTMKPPCYKEMREYLDVLKQKDRLKAEARNPYRTIQSAIISRSFAHFFVRQSNALSKVAANSKKPTLVPKFHDSDVDDAAIITAKDENAIRMIAHLFIFTRGVGQVSNDQQTLELASVNIIAYISYLQKMDKLELIPLYASLLQPSTCNNVLGRVLISVTEEGQRSAMSAAVKKQGLDMASVIDSQWKHLVSETMDKDDMKPIQIKRTVIRPKNGLPPKIVSSRNTFVCKRPLKESERLIQNLEWHNYVKDSWNKVCVYGKFLYKRFFTAGRLTEARLLHTRAPLDQLSYNILGRDITLGTELMEFNDQEDGDMTPTPDHPGSGRRQRQLEYIQSQTMRDLEMLIEVFEALDDWNVLIRELERAESNSQIRELTRMIRPAIDNITMKIHLVVADDWLDNPEDDAEKTELDFIRTTYLPEVVLQYHHALYTAGQAFVHEALVECMNLSMSISGTPNVLKAFIAAGRMTELADALAVSSLALLEYSSEESGTRKRLPQGATIDIWRVTKKPKVAADA